MTENNSYNIKCEDISKPVFFLFALKLSGEITEQEAENIIYIIIREFFGRVIPKQSNIESFFLLDDTSFVKNLNFKLIEAEFVGQNLI